MSYLRKFWGLITICQRDASVSIIPNNLLHFLFVSSLNVTPILYKKRKIYDIAIPLLILFLSWLLGIHVPLVLGHWVNLNFAKINYNRMPRN